MTRTRQPQRVTQINWGDSRASGLIAAYNFAGGLQNIVDGSSASLVNATRIVTSAGVGYTTTAGTRVGVWLPDYSALMPTAATILLVQKNATTNTQGWNALSGSSPDNDHYPYSNAIYTSAFWSGRWANGVATKVPFTDPHVVGIQVRAGSQRLSQNGITALAANAAGSYQPPAYVDQFRARIGGSYDSASYNYQGSTVAVLMWGRYLADAEVNSLSINPWQLFSPSRRVWVQLGPAAGGGAVTGTANITPAPQTLTGVGTVAISGAATVTPAAQTATTAASVAISGTLNKTPNAQTATAAGTVAVAGTFNKTPAAQTMTASGMVASGVTGTANITPAAQTVTASSAVAIAATATITPSAQTATTAGAILVGATATITPVAQTLTASGTIVSGVVGNASITPAAQTATASGTVAVAATTTVTPAAQTVSATAAVSGGAVTGTANIFVNAQTLVAAADIIVLGTATITPAPQTLLGLEAGTLPEEIPESSRSWSTTPPRLGNELVDTDPARLGMSPVRRNRPRLG
jgi:hypothetical protein